MTVQQLASGLKERLGAQLVRINRLAAVSSAIEVKGEFMQRILDKGRDSNGGIIGKYRSKKHVLERQKKGRQTKFKDYNFTGSLFGSVKIVNALNSVTIAIIDAEEVKKSREVEGQDKKLVFDLTKKELSNLESYHKENAKKLISQIQL